MDGTSRAAESLTPPAEAAKPPSILRRVRRDIVLLGAGNIGVVAAQLCFRSILIAALVPAEYGRLSLVLSVYNTVWIIGSSGVPSSVARYIALIAPADDSAIVRSAVRANALPTIVAATPVAIVSGVLLQSWLAVLFSTVGFASLVYTLLATGILRGRGRVGASASVMPVAGIGEVILIVTVWQSGLGLTPLSGFGVFCIGNVVGLLTGIVFVARTDPNRALRERVSPDRSRPVPSSRELLGLSMWLGTATVGIAALPLVLRFAAAFDSYTVVAIIDVAVVLFTIPNRIGAVIVAAVIPHAARAVERGDSGVTISRREHTIVVLPFLLAAAIVAFTPIVGWMFDALGRPEYAKSADYLALALLAGPARVLYGVVEGMLVAHGEGRFMGLSAFSIAAVASGMIVAAALLNSMIVAFVVFVIAFWAIYLVGLQRIVRLDKVGN
jgi:O-antigen/teichoic acid export membrane protein